VNIGYTRKRAQILFDGRHLDAFSKGALLVGAYGKVMLIYFI